jgi:hypothetical protein
MRLVAALQRRKNAFCIHTPRRSKLTQDSHAGWRLGEFTSTGGVFSCTRGSERRMVSVTPSAPGTEDTGGMHRAGAPGRLKGDR